MPQLNYSNSIIYRICCRDASITDEYIGSTTNKRSRKSNHKLNCFNSERKDYNLPIYNFIRNNGNWENWIFIILEEYPCENKIQLLQRERYWIELRKPTLNKQIPTRTQKEYDKLNEEKIKERRKKHYEENKKEIIKKICENQKQKIICSCGIEICKSSLSRHRKSQFHTLNSSNSI